MEFQEIWPLVLAASGWIASVVTFAVSVRGISKSRLEVEKLKLELAALKREAEAKEKLIQLATPDEILKYRDGHRGRHRTRDSDIMFSIAEPEGEVVSRKQRIESIRLLKDIGWNLLVVLVVGSVIHDIINIAHWAYRWLIN